MATTPGLMLTAAEAAARLGVARAQLDRWRRRGTGPAFVRLGRTIRYHPDAVKQWRDRAQP